MKNVLITGGAGFIGSNFVRYLLKAEPELQIVNLDALTYAGNLANLTNLPNVKHYRFVQGDICDAIFVEQLLEKYEIDTIVHFVAESHVDRSIAGAAPFIQTNIVGTFNLLQAAHNAWIDAFTHEKLLQASNFVQADEERQWFMIGWLEEIAYRIKFIDKEHIKILSKQHIYTNYGEHLRRLVGLNV